MRTKVKKRRINWRDVLFHLHKKRLSEEYTLFYSMRPKMSKNRCAYYVLKKNYSTTMLRAWRDLYQNSTMSYADVLSCLQVNVYGV